MKILYITPAGVKEDYLSGEKFEMDPIVSTISEGILSTFSDAEISLISDIVNNHPFVDNQVLDEYDLFLCDMTTSNPNISYHAGQLEALKKPVVYFRSSGSSNPRALSHNRGLIYTSASLNEEFLDKLNEVIRSFVENPSSFANESSEKVSLPKVFISYSHRDKIYLDRLMVHLKPLMKKDVVDIWVDTRIKTGDKWKESIENALNESNAAILLVSADFMASDFIIENELPPILSKAEVAGTKILPVVISPCRFSREPSLNRFQAANSPNNPLSAMTEEERELVYDQIAKDIEVATNIT